MKFAVTKEGSTEPAHIAPTYDEADEWARQQSADTCRIWWRPEGEFDQDVFGGRIRQTDQMVKTVTPTPKMTVRSSRSSRRTRIPKSMPRVVAGHRYTP